MFRITAPVPGFCGEVAGMDFVDGVAEGEPTQSALSYFRRRGYRVVEGDAQQPDPSPEGDIQGDIQGDAEGDVGGGDRAGKMPARSASKAAWRAYAVARGMSPDDADAATRDQLAELFHDKDG